MDSVISWFVILVLTILGGWYLLNAWADSHPTKEDKSAYVDTPYRWK